MIIIKIYTYNIYHRSFLKFVQLLVLALKKKRFKSESQRVRTIN